jgi:flavin reductase (DIM6/NTAB) family NADH-FMN oxidoreductase RutF
MLIDVAASSPVQVYQALVSVVAPRPIAWVSTIDEEARVNLAPFSFYNTFGANPPIVVFSPVLRRDGSKKDTLYNLHAVPEFVINSAVESVIERVNETSRELPPGVSEVEHAGLTLLPSTRVRPPRVAESPIHLECRVREIKTLGEGPIAPNLVIGEVLLIHIDDAMLDPNGQVDADKLRLVGRMAGNDYCKTTERFALERP